MALQVFRDIRKTAGQIACNSVLYEWSLRGHTPERMAVKPVDPWPGNADAGRWLCSGAFMIEDDQLQLRGDCWEPMGVDEAWLDHMHGFTWLRDLRALGGDSARRQARLMILSWMHHYPRWSAVAWRPDVTGERVAMWIALFENFGASADDRFQDLFFNSLTRQARHLSRCVPGELHGIGLLRAAKGLLYAGLAFEGFESWAEQALDVIEDQIDAQILGDGAHVSRSATQLLSALQILLDVKTALGSAAYPLPEKIQHAIDRMGPALRFFRYNDRHFGLFNGAQEAPSNGGQDFVDCVLAQAGMRGKSLNALPCAGYERVSMGRTLIMFDCGTPPAFPYDASAHAAPLAFEFSYGKERLFVACGSHPTSMEWKDSLRATAAHSTATIDHRNACEIRTDGHMARRARHIMPVREDTKNACLLEAAHDGYVPLNGITHRRRLYLTDQGHDLRGEDSFTCSVGLSRPHDVAIRFHLHPRILVSLTQGGEEALMRMPGGIGWRFHHSGGAMTLEDSVYMGQGSRPRKTKQLVITGHMSEDVAKIKWALQREG